MPTVLIGTGLCRNQPGQFREILKAGGFDTVDLPGDNPLTAEQLRAHLPGADALLAGGERMTAEMFGLAPRLRVIARTGVGYDLVDIPTATARNVAVVITPGTNEGAVAEHTLALMLALVRNIVPNDRRLHEGGWSRALVKPLRGQTLGLVGMGRIGRAVAVRARAFGMPLLAYDPAPADAKFDSLHEIKRVPLEELLAQSDFVSLHLPMTPETRGLINSRTLKLMRPGSYLINTARGGLVVEPDLRESLVSGHLGGAGLDVFNSEPPEPGNPLLGLPNVVLSPHVAGTDTRSLADMANLACQCIVDLKKGIWPKGCVVNDELGKDWNW
jgi:phosphoglycerate dehydrogenase-like enzyme